jgi:hypothetical protein
LIPFPGLVAFGQPRLMTFWKYAKVEMMPPMPAEFPAIQQGFTNLIKSAQKGKFMNLTMKVSRTCIFMRPLEKIFLFLIGAHLRNLDRLKKTIYFEIFLKMTSLMHLIHLKLYPCLPHEQNYSYRYGSED